MLLQKLFLNHCECFTYNDWCFYVGEIWSEKKAESEDAVAPKPHSVHAVGFPTRTVGVFGAFLALRKECQNRLFEAIVRLQDSSKHPTFLNFYRA